MHARVLILGLLTLPIVARAQGPLAYQVRYAGDKSTVHVSLTVPGGEPGPLTFVMPRTVPGGYSWRLYDTYVEQVQAFSTSGALVDVQRATMGPRWIAGKTSERVTRIEYDVNVARMEREIFDAVDSSRLRKGYAGFIGYSIFGYLEGHEERAIVLRIEGPSGWPVFGTLAPRVPADVGTFTASAPNYYALADSQFAMGPDLQLRQLVGRVPLFLAVYAETEEDLDEEGKIARDALDHVSEYFKDAPLAHYTVHIQLLRPISDLHIYTFSMEHLDSGTFTLGVARAITRNSTPEQREINRFNYAHHMAHSWVPKQSYGAGYLPFQWEVPPVIDTIWFNEGFGRYAAIGAMCAGLPPSEAEAYRQSKLDYVRGILQDTPLFLRRMPLDVLSRTGSFLYGDDWRIGQNLFSRGALMAAEIDDRIRAKTGGKKDFSDALRGALEWTRENRRGFRVEELPRILARGTGVDVRDIIERWLAPLER